MAALAFLQGLATEVSKGNVNLPCFPDVVIRIRQALEDPNTRVGQAIRIVGAEPRLAGASRPAVCRLWTRAAHMLSGADTPRSVRPLRITCCTPSTSARRALRKLGSPTMNCSAL